MTSLTAVNPARKALKSYGVVLALVVLAAAVAIAQPTFLSWPNQMNILSQWAPVAIMGTGMTFVMIAGGFDLSVGAVYALGAVIAAAIGATQAPVVAFIAAVLAGALAGSLNGLIVTLLKVNPFVATLGTSLLVAGLTLVITGNKPFIVAFEPFSVLGRGQFLGVPLSGILAIALLVAAGAVLAYTPYGQAIYAVGGNEEASRLAGIRTHAVTAGTYVVAGASAGIAGAITASQLGSAQASLSGNLVFDVLTVVIVGGTALGGGRGAPWRTAVGVGILATLQNGFNLLDIDPYYQSMIKGIIIIAALATFDWSLLNRLIPRRPQATSQPL